MENPKDQTIEMLENERKLTGKKAVKKLKKDIEEYNKGIHVKPGYEEFLNKNYPLKITPVSANNDQCIITMGNEMVVPLVFDNRDIAEKYIATKPIGLIFGMIATVVETSRKFNKNNKK